MAMESSNCLGFGEGSVVEVRSDVDGVWYEGKVVKPASGPQSHILKRKYNRKAYFYLVEYKTLVSEDGFNPLTELVGPSLIRPLPPPDDTHHPFQVNDVVDAFYRDGWWVGSVYRVLEESNTYFVSLENPPELLQFRRPQLRPHFDWKNGKWVPSLSQNKHKEDGTGTQQRKKRRLTKSFKGKDCDGAGGTVEKAVVKDCTVIDLESPNITQESTGSAEKEDELSDAGCSTKKDGMAIVKIPSDMDNAVKPISVRFKGCSPTNRLDSRYYGQETKGTVVEIAMQYSGKEATTNENRSPPLVKCSSKLKATEPMRSLPSGQSSSILKAIESLEVFQTMPQNPHFHPLDKYNQMYRDGLSIGYRVIFANVIEQTSKLQVNDPRSIFNSISEALVDLESYGFDVKIVRQRLTELQSIKEKQEQLEEEWKGFENQITEQTRVQNNVMEEFDDVFKKLKVLEEKKAMLVSAKEKNDSEIAALKWGYDAVKEDIQNAQLDFESVAAAPW